MKLQLFFFQTVGAIVKKYSLYDTFKIRTGERRKPKTTPRDNIEILRDDIEILRDDIEVLRDDIKMLRDDIEILRDDIEILRIVKKNQSKNAKNLQII